MAIDICNISHRRIYVHKLISHNNYLPIWGNVQYILDYDKYICIILCLYVRACDCLIHEYEVGPIVYKFMLEFDGQMELNRMILIFASAPPMKVIWPLNSWGETPKQSNIRFVFCIVCCAGSSYTSWRALWRLFASTQLLGHTCPRWTYYRFNTWEVKKLRRTHQKQRNQRVYVLPPSLEQSLFDGCISTSSVVQNCVGIGVTAVLHQTSDM